MYIYASKKFWRLLMQNAKPPNLIPCRISGYIVNKMFTSPLSRLVQMFSLCQSVSGWLMMLIASGRPCATVTY